MGVRPTGLWAWAVQHTRNLSRVALAVVLSLPLLLALGVSLWLLGPSDAGAQTASPFYTLRVYGRGYYGAGADNIVDPGAGLTAQIADPATGAVPEDAPYTDLAGVFHPQHPQAPRMDSVTWNPAYMAEGFTFDENQRRGLYNQMFANGINIAEKVWHRIWYEPEHWDKDINADNRLTRDPLTGRPRDPRLQNGLPVWLDDIWYPAIQQEFTYTLLENQEPVPRGSAKPEPVFGRAGTVQFVFPVGMRASDLFDANGQLDTSDTGNGGRGYGLTSLDADFDGTPDIVHVDSELTLFDKTGIAADFNGDGLLQGLRQGSGLTPDGSELAILHVNLSNRPLQVGQYAQFLDHVVRVSALYNDSVRLEFWYTGDLRPRYLGSQLLYVGDMALAGTQGPTQLIGAVRNGGPGSNLCQFPVGPWFAYVETVDTVDGTAALWLGRGLGRPFSAMEDGIGVPDRRPGDPWCLKRMYVDGHEYNVVAISARGNGAPIYQTDCNLGDGRGDLPAPYDPSDFEFITLRQPIPKGPDILIAQHSVRLRGYQPDECLPKLPPYNYEHYILADIVQLDELTAAIPTPGAINPTPTATPGSAENLIYYFGKLVGPVPPILQANAPFPYTTENGVYNNPRETKWSYREETREPSFLGVLREKYGERPQSAEPLPGQPPTEFFYAEQFWTLPWSYTEFALPDLADARTGTRRDPATGREVANPDLYLLTSAFRAPQGQYQLWTQDRTTPFRWGDWPIQVDPPPFAAQNRVKFWFDPARSPDPAANPSGKIYRDAQGLRLYGKTFRDPDDFTGTAGDISVTRDANGYRVEVPPYTDPWAPFNPQLPQAPRKDSLTFNPAYLDEFRNSNEALASLYGSISIEGADAREKVYFRQWYENSYLDKLRFESDRTRDYRFSALMQEFTYLFLDTQDRPAHAQPGNSRLALPMATGRNELPVPPSGAGVSWNPTPSFGYGLTSFDANFDGTPDIVTIDSEQSLARKTGIRADFNGNGQVDSLRPAGAPDVDGLAIFSVENFVLRRGESLQFMDHLVTLKNIGVGGFGSQPTADVDFWYTGGGLHALGLLVPPGLYPRRQLQCR
ncbi:MAG: hypothetical protein KIT87_00930 [Anaerolineae bacterium]|nr:hypothetical protein [Anaerolineae bacterium]